MSGSVHDAAPSPGGRPAGLLEKLMAAIRPEFRAEVLTFEARRSGVRRAGMRGTGLPSGGPLPADVLWAPRTVAP